MNPIKLVSQNFYKELSTSPVNWLLGNVGDKIRVETIFSVENYAISTPDDPFIINNINGMVGTGWIYDPLGGFTNFNIGDTVIYFDQTDGSHGTKTILDKLDNSNIQVAAFAAPSNTAYTNFIISNTTPITSVKYHYNFIENGSSDSFLSPFDNNEQLLIIENKAASSTGAVAMKFQGALTWQSGSATIQGVSIDDGTTDGVYKSRYKIIHYTKITPYLLYNMVDDQIAEIYPKDFLKTKCWKFITQIEAAEAYTNPNFLVSEIFDTELGNTGWYNENFNTGKSNYSISNLVYKNAGKTINSIQFDASETTITFNTNNLTDTPFSNNNTKFIIGFFKVPADPSEYQNNNTLLDQNFLFDRALQTVGSGAVNGDNYGGNFQVLKSITGIYVSSSVITITCKIDMAAAVLAAFEASSLPRYFLYVSTQNYNYDTDNPLNDAITLEVDLNTFTVISSDPTMIVPSNVFIRHPELDPATEGVKLGFDNTSLNINTVATGTSPIGIAFNYIDNKIYSCDTGSGPGLTVINSKTNAVITTIPAFGGVGSYFQAAFDSFNKRIYTTSDSDGIVTAIDSVTDIPITTISCGTAPSGIAYNSINKKIYVCCYGSSNIKVIDTTGGSDNTVTATIFLTSNPIGIAFNSLMNTMYVSLSAADKVIIIDCITNAITTISLTASDEPYGLTYNTFSNKIYVNCLGAGYMKVIDCITNAITTIPTIAGTYSCYNPTDNQIITQLNSTQIVIIDCLTNEIVSTTTLSGGILSFCFDFNDYKIFISNASGNYLWCIDSTFDVFPEDEIVACSNFYIESAGRTTDVIKLTSINAKIIASDGTNEFELDQFIMQLGSIPLTGYTQQFDSQVARVFHIPLGTIRKYIEVKRRTDLDTGTRKYFSSNYPFLFRWETWVAVLGADPSFFDSSLPNNGFNQWWFRYSNGTFKLYYKLIINATKNGVPQQYTLLNQITPHDYSSNAEWTTKNIVTKDPDTLSSLMIGGNAGILGFKDTLMVATLTKSSLPTGYTIEFKIDPAPGGISTARKFSSKWDWSSDTWFKSIDTSNKVVMSISGDTITAKALIDYTKLDPSIKSYKISWRVYDNIGNALTTDDGVPITTDDGLQITID